MGTKPSRTFVAQIDALAKLKSAGGTSLVRAYTTVE
jgi:hypothetical protein